MCRKSEAKNILIAPCWAAVYVINSPPSLLSDRTLVKLMVGETGAPGGNPPEHRENMQTSHKGPLEGLLLVVRQEAPQSH